MKIGFDAKRLYNNFTGLGNYSRFIVDALAKHYPENEYCLFTPAVKANPETEPFLKAPNITTTMPPSWMRSMKFGSLWRSFNVASDASKQGVELYHGLSHELPRNIPKKMKSVVTVHDLIFLRFPQFYKSVDVSIYKAKVNHACKVADKVVAISEQTAQDVVHFLKVDRSKIAVVYQGSHPNFKREFSTQQLDAIRQKYNLPNQFILNVGTIEKRKNVMLAIKALQILNESVRVPLVIVGRSTAYADALKAYIKDNNLTSHVIFIHNASFVDLPGIYKLAQVFVYPSLFEGFGIPLVEAITCGLPVITSVGSCFSEAAGPSSTYIDPHDAGALAHQLETLLTNDVLRNKSIEESKVYIKKFEPHVIAQDMMQVYQNLYK